MTRFFIDTEFIEDGKTIDLVSIAIVTDREIDYSPEGPPSKVTEPREYYAVSLAAELHRASAWVRENVLPHLPPYGDPAWKTRWQIAEDVRRFVLGDPTHMTRPRIEFWGYYADYDWVALCQLFGKMIDLPDGFPMYCGDLKQRSVALGSPEHPPKPKDEHNALIDARWNRELARFLDFHERVEKKGLQDPFQPRGGY